LAKGLAELKIDIKDSQINDLMCYLELFYKWNKAINLSAIRKPEEIVTRHLLDSLVLVPYLSKYIKSYREDNSNPLRIIDVGTGGGLPGIPLAIYFPNINVTLLDSNGKKTHFLFQTALKLGLSNVSIENKRVESFVPEIKFDIVTSRAFASLSDMLKGSQHLLSLKGQYWAMKGLYPETELKDCSEKVDIIAVHKLQIPKSHEQRHLVVLAPKLKK
jgi:16S rRNA (guanine527-N7)-methyltransferase